MSGDSAWVASGTRGMALRFIALAFPIVSSAQEPEAERFRRFQEAQERQFTSFLSAQDSAFASYLDRAWRAMDGVPPARPYAAPKLVAAPRVGPTRPVAAEVAPAPAPVVRPLLDAAPAPAPQAVPQSAPRAAGLMLTIPYFATSVELTPPRLSIPALASPVEGKSIAAFYREVAALDWQPLRTDLRARATTLVLDDYAYAQLVLRTARTLVPDENRARLVTWYLLLQEQIDARVAYVGREPAAGGLRPGTVVLLVPSTVMVYSVPYFTFGGERYFAVSMDAVPAPAELGALFTYEGSHPGEPRKMNLRLVGTPKLGVVAASRTLTWTYGDSTYTLSVRVDRNAVRYLEWYPQVEWDVWFGIQMSAPARETLLAGLRPMVAGRSEREQVNFLLRFVQTAFAYQTDAEQFGREKPMSVDETLFYAYSDCEDRAVLFAAVVRTLLGLDVVALKYPGHLATAVRLRDGGEGVHVEHDGGRWMVSDPTYIGGNVGEVMPEFRGVTPIVIRVQ